MFAIHCNNCFENNQQNSTLHFYFSSCEHIFCKECVNSICTVCKRSYTPTLICKNMPPELAAFFQNNQKMFRSFQMVTQFQLKQMAHFANYHVNTLPALKKKVIKQNNGLIRLGGQIADALKAENQRIEKLKDYLNYHERRLEEMPLMIRQQPPILGRKRLSSTGSQISRVQTPTLSLPDSNTDGSTHTVSERSHVSSKRNPCNFQL